MNANADDEFHPVFVSVAANRPLRDTIERYLADQIRQCTDDAGEADP